MWNKIAALAQETSYKRLALALLLSVLAHAYLFGGLDISLPFLKKEMHTIEARIQMPKAEPPKSVPEMADPEPEKPKLEPKPKEPPPPEPEQDKAPEPPVEPPSIDNAAPEPIAETAPVVGPEKTEVAPEPELPQPQPELPDAGLVINENAYRYVETYFDVRTKIDGPTEGKAKIVYNLMDDSHYQLNFVVEAKGLAAIFLPDLLQTSEGLLTKTGLQPTSYTYKFGDKEDKARKAMFDWQSKTLQLTTNKGLATVPLLDGAQDQLSFMYQFMYVAPLQQMQLNITNGKKLSEYNYTFEGEDLVLSSLGEIKAFHIVHAGKDDDEKTELWLAIDYQNIPIKIRKTEKGGKVYEFIANQIVTTRPTIDSPQQVK